MTATESMPRPKDSLEEYLRWLREEWLPSIKAGTPLDRPRPKLVLIKGGRDG